MSLSRAVRCAVISISAALPSCEPATLEAAPAAIAAPATADSADLCADVGDDARVCWPTEAPIVVPRPEPTPRPERGLRCEGTGAARRCTDRRVGSDRFRCSGDTCIQRHPRMPDDGEWECVDADGIVVCRGGDPPSGVAAGPPDLGWMCGVVAKEPPERVCVDLAPDRSSPGATCRYNRALGTARRICQPSDRLHPLSCDAGCPFGTACTAGRCMPLRPEPSCWLDPDCPAGHRCAHGTCRSS